MSSTYFKYDVEVLRDIMDTVVEISVDTNPEADDINAVLILLSEFCALRILEIDPVDEDALQIDEHVQGSIIGIMDYLFEGMNKIEGVQFKRSGDYDAWDNVGPLKPTLH